MSTKNEPSNDQSGWQTPFLFSLFWCFGVLCCLVSAAKVTGRMLEAVADHMVMLVTFRTN
jgi:hypothetical protein